eukprot:scaffold370_cov176-Amphora_coffeaeformis.AAC.14
MNVINDEQEVSMPLTDRVPKERKAAGKRIRRLPRKWCISSVHALIFVYIFSFIGGDVGCERPGVEKSETLPLFPFPAIPPVCALRAKSRATTKDRENDNGGTFSSVAANGKQKLSVNQILIRAGKRGLGGGIPGALAGIIQVLTLMWLRTTANHQSRYGTSFMQAIRVLYREGGIRRLYRGLSFALIQAPLVRFVSTAANDGVESFLGSFEMTRNWGPGRTTVFASIIVGIARIALMPIDTMKTVLQVDSSEGFRNLVRRLRAGKFGVLYQGSVATAISAIAGHYPWFYTYNFLASKDWVTKFVPSKLLRNAAIGFCASIISDTTTNFLKVIKTTKQALGSKHSSSYAEVVRMIVAADGWKGLFGRGLKTRIGTNALQSILFTIIWRGLSEKIQEWGNARRGEEEKDQYEY